MEKRTFKKNGKDISLLGFGAMRLPVVDGKASQIDQALATQMLADAFAGGINYFDTAYNYHEGASEPFMGKALSAYPRESYHLATKLPMWLVETRADAERIFEEQLARSQSGYIDFYLCHSMIRASFEKMQKLDIFSLLEEKRSQGLIRNIGFSFHDTPDVLRDIAAAHPWDFAQLQLNYLDWDYLRGAQMYQTLEEHGIPCIVMEPVRGGTLANLGPQANAVLQQAAPGASIASWALRWVAALPNVLCVLSGMSTPAQLADNISTFSPLVPLSAEEQAALNEALDIFKAHATVPCTACRYCMPCPFGVNIPGMFDMYNRSVFDWNNMYLKSWYSKSDPATTAAACTACGRCEKLCPQHIPIAQQLAKIHTRATGQ